MATGDYYIEAKGLDQLVESLVNVKGGLKDLRSAWQEIAEDAGHYVKAHAPVGSPHKHDSKTHPAPGGLRDSVKWGAAAKRGPWVSAGNQDTPYLFVQEFGGKAFWSKSGRGALRASNRAHRGALDAASRAGIKGHVIYEKARNRRGYFIWNTAYRLRTRIGKYTYEGIGNVCRKHGLPYEMPSNTTLDIPQQSWRG